MIKAKRLKNGMRYHLVPFTGTEAMTTLVLTKVGSRYEPETLLGGSHFIEHMMFKGTKKRPKTIDISKALDRYGAEYNAYTGKDRTGYYVKIAGDHAQVAIELLYDMLFHSLYETKELNRERKVIIEEIKMYEENPILHVGDLLEQAMFDGNPLGREIAGTPQSVMTMKKADIMTYRGQYYMPSEMVIVLAGKVPTSAIELLRATFGKVKATKQEPPTYLPFGEMPERKTPRLVRQFKPLKQIQIALGFPMPGAGHKDMLAIKLLSTILGGAMSSRLFIEVREKRGLCYFVRATSDAYEDVGTFVIRAGLDAERLALALKTIVNELRKIKKAGVTAQELRYAKDHIEGATKLQLEDSSQRAEYYGRQELIFGQVESPQARLDKIKKVTRRDIQRVANEVLNFKKLSIAAIGPYKTDAALLKYIPVLS
ncbi:insulinase family protein [Patescibacteria group bacterium]|nr:insulinase family protein [Patescibacteria group bacterium]